MAVIEIVVFECDITCATILLNGLAIVITNTHAMFFSSLQMAAGLVAMLNFNRPGLSIAHFKICLRSELQYRPISTSHRGSHRRSVINIITI